MQKEAYFTPETIHEKSAAMLEAVADSRRRHANIIFDPRRAALLVLDLQEYFLQESSHAFVPSACAIIPNIQALINIFSSHDRPVIFTRHVNTPENAAMMSRWWKDLIRSGSPESKISFLLDISNGLVVQKGQYDAFYESELQGVLSSNEVEQVVITGVMTHLCCETTARSAFVRGFEVLFVINGTATYTEGMHRASLQNLSHGFVVPVLSEEIIRGFE
ncbi:MAG TPA: isochorismatase family protein [Acidobacteriota bacterium]|nr:isochorismatase family protein [Acidobacteriota bacterium]